jgi:hypothetical protein
LIRRFLNCARRVRGLDLNSRVLRARIGGSDNIRFSCGRSPLRALYAFPICALDGSVSRMLRIHAQLLEFGREFVCRGIVLVRDRL